MQVFERNVLLKINRDYSQDEAVQFLLKDRAKYAMEVGVLKGEVDELREIIKELKRPKPIPQPVKAEIKTKKEWLQDEVVAMIEEEKRRAVASCKIHKDNYKYWQNKFFSLQAKLQKDNL